MKFILLFELKFIKNGKIWHKNTKNPQK